MVGNSPKPQFSNFFGARMPSGVAMNSVADYGRGKVQHPLRSNQHFSTFFWFWQLLIHVQWHGNIDFIDLASAQGTTRFLKKWRHNCHQT